MQSEPMTDPEQVQRIVTAINEAGARMAEILQPAAEAFVEALDNFAEAARSTFDAMAGVLQSTISAIYAEYLRQGAPYGETQEGCLRWLEEQGEIARHQAGIERIQERQQMMAEMRVLAMQIAERNDRDG